MIGQTISHYRILAEVGRGGMGVVYKAHDTALDRDVALKFLPAALTGDPDAHARFIREAKAASALDHPNICTIHEIGRTDDGSSFICMSYYQGETLKERIERSQIRIDEAIDIALQIADGLQRAHESRIVHRDIKPANIFLASDGGVKILDFGLATLAGDAGGTTSSRRAGTAAYMSPEQVQGQKVDRRTDLYALGVVMYEMITGRRPFAGEHELALFYSIVNTDPPPISRFNPDVTPALEEIVRKLLHKDPAHRYQSAADLLSDLRSLRQGSAPSPSALSGKGAAFAGKRRTIALAALVVVALGIVLTVIRPGKALTIKPAEYILVADVDNRTGDRVFDHSITEAIKVSLRQSARFNIFPPERATEAMKRMKVAAAGSLPDTLAVAMAQREGVRVVIGGSIQKAEGSFILSSKIIDAVTGEVVRIFHRETGDFNSILREVDRMCEDLRQNLGESIQEISRYTMPLERVTTSSLEALELYSIGNTYEGQGQYQEAAALKEQALAKDSLFTMAVSDLSYIYRKLGNDSLALYYHARVLPLLGRVTDRERFYIESIYYGPSFELNYTEAFREVQNLVLRYPNSPEGYATLGHLAMYVGDTKMALEANAKSLEIDSVYAGTVFNNTGYALALDSRAGEALEYYRKSKKIRPTYSAIDNYIAQSYWIRGDYDSAEQTLQSLLSVAEPRRKVLAFSQLASLSYFRGRLQESADRCAEALEFCRSQQRPGDEAWFHYLLGEIGAERSNPELQRREFSSAERLSVSPYPELPLIGASYARQGNFSAADRILRKLANLQSRDPYFMKRKQHFIHLVLGELALKRNDAVGAGKEFGAVERLHSADPYYLLAQRGIILAAGSDSAAVRGAQSVVQRKGEVVMGFILSSRNSGPWIRTLWPDLELGLARILLRQRQPDRAKPYLADCLAIWDKADRQFGKRLEAERLLAIIPEDR